MMETASTSETSVILYQTTRLNISEDNQPIFILSVFDKCITFLQLIKHRYISHETQAIQAGFAIFVKSSTDNVTLSFNN
jgi:hypothetical protein